MPAVGVVGEGGGVCSFGLATITNFHASCKYIYQKLIKSVHAANIYVRGTIKPTTL